MKLLWLSAVLALLGSTLAANILTVLPYPSKSHGILVERLLRELASKGHSVTYITANPPTKPLGSTTVIAIPDLRAAVYEDNPLMKDGNLLEIRDTSPWTMMAFFPTTGPPMCDYLLGLEQVQALLRSSQKFDLIMGEIFMSESVLAGLSYKYKVPIVGIQLFIPTLWSNYMGSNPAPASHIPDAFLGYDSTMTLLERTDNLIFGLAFEFLHTNVHLRSQGAVMRKYFGQDLPPIQDIIKNVSLVLVNHHFSLAFPRAYVPNMVEIGGIHIDKPKPLPKDLQEFMDNSKNGVIFFSMGTNVRADQMSPEIRNAILKALSKLKENVLWKFESELPNLPKNVRISSWFPQSDLLAHPNMKLFITHGGLLSTTEAVERAVPIIGIPIYGDQVVNMKQATNYEFGLTLKYEDINEQNFYNAIKEVITNPKYKNSIQQRSALLKDNPMPPVERAIWWIEYVIRHKGASHLRSTSLYLTWYQFYLLDVIALLAAVIIPVVAIIYCITKAILRKLFCRTCSKDSSKEKKKITKKDE